MKKTMCLSRRTLQSMIHHSEQIWTIGRSMQCDMESNDEGDFESMTVVDLSEARRNENRGHW
jgi:hypothetical protein